MLKHSATILYEEKITKNVLHKKKSYYLIINIVKFTKWIFKNNNENIQQRQKQNKCEFIIIHNTIFHIFLPYVHILYFTYYLHISIYFKIINIRDLIIMNVKDRVCEIVGYYKY